MAGETVAEAIGLTPSRGRELVTAGHSRSRSAPGNLNAERPVAQPVQGYEYLDVPISDYLDKAEFIIAHNVEHPVLCVPPAMAEGATKWRVKVCRGPHFAITPQHSRSNGLTGSYMALSNPSRNQILVGVQQTGRRRRSVTFVRGEQQEMGAAQTAQAGSANNPPRRSRSRSAQRRLENAPEQQEMDEMAVVEHVLRGAPRSISNRRRLRGSGTYGGQRNAETFVSTFVSLFGLGQSAEVGGTSAGNVEVWGFRAMVGIICISLLIMLILKVMRCLNEFIDLWARRRMLTRLRRLSSSNVERSFQTTRLNAGVIASFDESSSQTWQSTELHRLGSIAAVRTRIDAIRTINDSEFTLEVCSSRAFESTLCVDSRESGNSTPLELSSRFECLAALYSTLDGLSERTLRWL